MKTIESSGCFVFVCVCLAASASHAQLSSFSPQPDGQPAVTQSAELLLSQIDKNKDQPIEPQELRSVLKALIIQIKDLRREIQSLKYQYERLQQEQPRLHVTRKPVLGPADGGVYGGKYYPPAQSVREEK